MSPTFDSRVGAYALIISDQRILLTHWNPSRPGFDGAWTLPGGGMEPGEQPEQAVVREVFEETGYTATLDGLLGVHSRWALQERRSDGHVRDFHAFRVLYTARVVSGDLTVEQNGSSDDVRWFPLAELDEITRLDLVDRALHLAGLEHVVTLPETPPQPVSEEESDR